MSELSVLADFIVGLELRDVPEAARKAGVFHVLDTVGTAVGATVDPQVISVTEEWMKKDSGGNTHIWGTGKTASVGTSLFLNAMMGHTQEMDDVHTNSKTHIGTVVVPAAWAVAEYLGASGADFLLAVICGYETMSRVGMAFGVSAHRNRGWHVTATAGTFGAAAAVGKLLGLDREKMKNALGLAGAQSFGTWAFLGDGATSKTLNPARAALSGSEAAFLAKAGMTGPEHILTAEDGGLLSCMADGGDAGQVKSGLGQKWQILEVDNKPYPTCRSTHCAIDAAMELRRKYGMQAEEIDRVDVETYLVGYKQCGVSEGSVHPATAVHAKFSTPFAVACAFLYGEVTLVQLKDEVVQEPQIQDLLKRVRVMVSDEFTSVYPAHWGCRVTVYKKDGSHWECCVKDASGSVDRPLTEMQVKEKAVSSMRGIIGGRTEEVAETILHIASCKKIPVLAGGIENGQIQEEI